MNLIYGMNIIILDIFSFQDYDNQNDIPINKIIKYLKTKLKHKLKILDL